MSDRNGEVSGMWKHAMSWSFMWFVGCFCGIIFGWHIRIDVDRPTINGVQTWCEPPIVDRPTGPYIQAIIHHGVTLGDRESWSKTHPITASGACGLCKGEAPVSRDELEGKAR